MLNTRIVVFISLAILFSLVSVVFVNAYSRKKIDLAIVGEAYGSSLKSENWSPHADLNHDKVINIYDLALASKINLRELKKTEDIVYSAEGSTPEISVEPHETLIGPGVNDFTIDINITDATDTWAWEVNLTWDPSVINFTDFSEGTFLNQTIYETYCAEDINYIEGWTRIGCTLLDPATPASDNGTLATINFTILDEGSSTLDLYNTILLDTNLDPYVHTTEDGYALVDYTAPTVTITSPKEGAHYYTLTSWSIPLKFTVNEPTSWCGYSLDGGANKTLENCANTGLSNLKTGSHTIIVYAKDIVGNEGSSNPVSFSVTLSDTGGGGGGGGAGNRLLTIQ